MILKIGTRMMRIPASPETQIYTDKNQLRRELRFRFQLNISSRHQKLFESFATDTNIFDSPFYFSLFSSFLLQISIKISVDLQDF